MGQRFASLGAQSKSVRLKDGTLSVWDQPKQRHIEELISPNTGDTLVLMLAPST